MRALPQGELAVPELILDHKMTLLIIEVENYELSLAVYTLVIQYMKILVWKIKYSGLFKKNSSLESKTYNIVIYTSWENSEIVP